MENTYRIVDALTGDSTSQLSDTDVKFGRSWTDKRRQWSLKAVRRVLLEAPHFVTDTPVDSRPIRIEARRR